MKKTNEDESRKKFIKIWMYFKYRGKFYIKIGKRCAEIDVNSSILFDEVKAEGIEFIYNSNGTLKMGREKIDGKNYIIILDEDVEECEK